MSNTAGLFIDSQLLVPAVLTSDSGCRTVGVVGGFEGVPIAGWLGAACCMCLMWESVRRRQRWGYDVPTVFGAVGSACFGQWAGIAGGVAVSAAAVSFGDAGYVNSPD